MPAKSAAQQKAAGAALAAKRGDTLESELEGASKQMEKSMSGDPYHLARFTSAQDGVIDTALKELQAGRKRTHWMWFVFPQLSGLGISPMAQFYGISSLGEAGAYLHHPLLSRRLTAVVAAAQTAPAASAHALFGSPDDGKFRSSMTLFSIAVGGGVYQAALDRWFDGERDSRTVELLTRTRAEGAG